MEASGGAVAGLGSLRSIDELKVLARGGVVGPAAPRRRITIANELRRDPATHLVLGLADGRIPHDALTDPAAPRLLHVLCWSRPPGADPRVRPRRRHPQTSFARDLINTPANDLGPAELAAAATRPWPGPFSERARPCVIVGDELLAA